MRSRFEGSPPGFTLMTEYKLLLIMKVEGFRISDGDGEEEGEMYELCMGSRGKSNEGHDRWSTVIVRCEN